MSDSESETKRSRSRSKEKEVEKSKETEVDRISEQKKEERRKRFGVTEEELKVGNTRDRRGQSDSSGRKDGKNSARSDRYERNSKNDRNSGAKIKYYDVSEEEINEFADLKLGEVLVKEFREDPKATQDYKFNLEFDSSHPKGNPLLGNLDELNEVKMKITPVVREWERAKFLISEYELIDTSRPRVIADERYNYPIIRYNTKTDVREGEDLTLNRDAIYPVYSRAYFKLWEVLSEAKVLEKFKNKILFVANVAEGPGGFIQALIDFRKRQKNDMKWKEDSYSAITLKIGPIRTAISALDWEFPKSKAYFDMLKDNNYRVKLSYGTGDGDLYKVKNIEYFAEEQLNKRKCELVTADGGVGLTGDDEFSAQEAANAKLFFAEIITAFSVQEKGGTFVMKIYDFYSTVGFQLLAILRGHYEKIKMIKPLTSRPANAEKYLICEGFKGVTEEKLKELKETLSKWGESQGKPEYLKNDLFLTNLTNYEPTSDSILVQDLREINDIVALQQKPIIEKGLELIEKKELNNEDLIKECKLKQKKLGELWCEKHDLPYIKNLKLSKLKEKYVEER